jgi:hypothetical protein
MLAVAQSNLHIYITVQQMKELMALSTSIRIETKAEDKIKLQPNIKDRWKFYQETICHKADILTHQL